MKYSTFLLEKSLLDQGYASIAGMDEAGRGCWAGPVVAAVAVISDEGQYIEGVLDSKVMAKLRREKMYEELRASLDEYGIGAVNAEEIDEIGINEAGRLAMQRAYEQLGHRPEIVLVDGSRILSPNVTCLKIDRGDQKHFIISAASVLAKVYRDRFMCELAHKYAGYGFENHVGYGTAQHQAALDSLGITEIHRKSYSPIKKLLTRGGNGKKMR